MERKNLFDQLIESSFMTKIVLATVVVIWAVVFVMLIAVTTLMLEQPSEAMQSTAVATVPTIRLNPVAASAGSTVTVEGEGWSAGSQVLIYLAGAEAANYAISSTTVDSAGHFTTDFIFPSDPRWSSQATIQVLAQAADSGVSAQAFLTLFSTVESATATPTETALPGPTDTATPVIETPTSTPVVQIVTATPLPGAASLVATTNLNVRSGPGSNYSTVGLLQNGQTAAITGLSYDRLWWQIKFATGLGWVSAQYVTAQNVANVPLVQANSAPPAAPTATPLPAATATPVVITDWRGEYYNNTSLSGAPVLVRNEIGVNFNWGGGSPAASVPADNFSARWTRSQYFDGGTYRFHIQVDDGVRLWVDNSLVIDAWSDGAPREVTGQYSLGSGQHAMRVEYYERTGGASINLWGEKLSNQDDGNNDDDEDYSDWKGEYYSDRNLDDREFTRNDNDIDFDWGDDAPGNLSSDDFSVRWSREYDFRDGLYRFTARADDGIRVYIDGKRVIDEWHSSNGSQLYTFERNIAGNHDLEVEYYENGGEAKVDFSWKRIGDRVTPTPTPTSTPTATPTTDPQVVALNLAIAHLAALTGLPSSEIVVVSGQVVDWPDTQLGCPRDGVSGSPVITPGYLIILSAAGQQYEYHADRNGHIVLCQPDVATPTPTSTATTVPTGEPTATSTPTSTTTPVPTGEPTATPTETATQEPTATPTETATAIPTETPTVTPEPPTSTPEPPTATPEPPTATPEPPTATPEPPTTTPEPPTATPEPPTATPEPPTPTPDPLPADIPGNLPPEQ